MGKYSKMHMAGSSYSLSLSLFFFFPSDFGGVWAQILHTQYCSCSSFLYRAALNSSV